MEERTGLEFLPLPAGEFRMGSAAGDPDARPVHLVRLKGFQLAKTEVTRAQYARFMSATGRTAPAHWSNPRFTKDSLPVLGVTYADALAFCAWAGGRLPTEAEWEYAARGTDGRLFPWGNEEPEPPPHGRKAVFHLDVATAPYPVGSAPEGASPFDLLDMAGNLFEWCMDWYDEGYYAVSPMENPTGPAKGERRVIRGGCWVSLPDACAATARSSSRPDSPSTMVGFRVARSASALPP